MSDINETEIIERIQKLLSMTSEAGCSEHEAATAAEFAARLMAKHNINQERLGTPSENNEELFFYSRGRADWQNLVAAGVAKRFGCAVFSGQYGATFFGRGESPQAAGKVWSWLVTEMPRIALKKKAWKLGNMDKYMLGMATAVYTRLKEQNAKAPEDIEADNYAIVRADVARDEMHKAHPDLRTNNSLDRKINKNKSNVAFLIGVLDGADVALGTEEAIESRHVSSV